MVPWNSHLDIPVEILFKYHRVQKKRKHVCIQPDEHVFPYALHDCGRLAILERALQRRDWRYKTGCRRYGNGCFLGGEYEICH